MDATVQYVQNDSIYSKINTYLCVHVCAHREKYKKVNVIYRWVMRLWESVFYVLSLFCIINLDSLNNKFIFFNSSS